MSAGITLYSDRRRKKKVASILLSDIYLAKDAQHAEGEPTQVFGRNTGSTTIQDLTVGVDGLGAEAIQLAIDNDGEPGAWAAPGRGIHIAPFIDPRDEFSFWSRGLFEFGEAEGNVEFEFVMNGVSIG